MLDRIEFVGLRPFSRIIYGVAMETMHFHIAHTKFFLKKISFCIQVFPMNNLAPIKICPVGVQGNLIWMPVYISYLLKQRRPCTLPDMSCYEW